MKSSKACAFCGVVQSREGAKQGEPWLVLGWETTEEAQGHDAEADDGKPSLLVFPPGLL